MCDVKSLNENDEFWGLNPNYKAILEVDRILTEKGIPHELWRLCDGWKIAYPTQKNCFVDVIEHRGSYGHEEDLMESMDIWGDIKDYMTVGEAIAMFEETYNQHTKN